MIRLQSILDFFLQLLDFSLLTFVSLICFQQLVSQFLDFCRLIQYVLSHSVVVFLSILHHREILLHFLLKTGDFLLQRLDHLILGIKLIVQFEILLNQLALRILAHFVISIQLLHLAHQLLLIILEARVQSARLPQLRLELQLLLL